MLKRLIAAAALAGAVSGMLLTALQQIEIVPLIRAAEAREVASMPHTATAAHADQAWAPRDSAERLVATTVANIILATAFALLLGAAMSLRRQFGWRAGVAWGIAGYAAFFVAPALGLAPELPGTGAAPLADRQVWWIGAAGCSATGLWLAAFARKALPRILGVALLIAPHAVGAPLPAVDASAGEEARAFIRASYVANAALWLVLGVLVGWLVKPGESPGAAGRHRSSGIDTRPPR
ncbi:MAG: CbtA family protein [Betaproteobacteria bacterium]